MDKLVVRLLAAADLWVPSRHRSKLQNGRHKQGSSQHTVARQKYIQKIYALTK
jgi:hypothetical protein